MIFIILTPFSVFTPDPGFLSPIPYLWCPFYHLGPAQPVCAHLSSCLVSLPMTFLNLHCHTQRGQLTLLVDTVLPHSLSAVWFGHLELLHGPNALVGYGCSLAALFSFLLRTALPSPVPLPSSPLLCILHFQGYSLGCHITAPIWWLKCKNRAIYLA